MAVIVLLTLVSLFVFFSPLNRQPAEVVKTEEKLPPLANQIKQLPPPSPQRVANEQNYPLGLEQFALAYAERFASYSSDANFKNLKDLKLISTPKMQSFIDDLIAASTLGSLGYEAAAAKALNSQLVYSKDDKALIEISLQLTKFSGDRSQPVTEYNRLHLTSIKVGEQWQIDEAEWQ